MRHEQIIHHEGRDYTFIVETRPEPKTSHMQYHAHLIGTEIRRAQLGPMAHDQFVDMIKASTSPQPKFGHAPITRVNLRNYHAAVEAAAARKLRKREQPYIEEYDDAAY